MRQFAEFSHVWGSFKVDFSALERLGEWGNVGGPRGGRQFFNRRNARNGGFARQNGAVWA